VETSVRKILLLITMLICSAGLKAIQADALVGHWEGWMDRAGDRLLVSFEFTGSPKELAGRFTCPRQRAMDYPLNAVSQNGTRVQFALDGGIQFEGRLSNQELIGDFKDEGEAGTFALKRGPKPLFPYTLENITFASGGMKLAGTIVAPRAPGKHAAVVLLQGSGPETRWGTNRFIADRMARAGVVTLIYDKRGSGESTGDWRTADYNDLAKDALSAVEVLRRRTDVDEKRLGLHGHSQGGIVAANAARLSPSSVAFIVAEDTVVGPVWQQDLYRVSHALSREFRPEAAASAMRLYTLFLEVARGLRPYAELEAASALVAKEPWFEWLGIPPRNSWLWPWYAKTGTVDTLDYWRAVRVPVLLVYGERDRIVPVDESLSRLADLLERNGTPFAALIAPHAEHNLTIHPQPGEPFFWWHAAPGIVDTVVAWVSQGK
jgi:alpha-beta hydrolase superfamily lysophospholipase